MNSIPTFTESLICQKSNGVDAASIVAGQAPQTSKISSTGKDWRDPIKLVLCNKGQSIDNIWQANNRNPPDTCPFKFRYRMKIIAQSAKAGANAASSFNFAAPLCV